MDLTTEAIKELKHAFDALPSLPGTDRAAAAEVLALLQSVSPGAHALSADRVLALIRGVTTKAAGAPPAAGKAAVVVDLHDDAPGTQAVAPASRTAASPQGATSPAAARSPTARSPPPPPHSPLAGDLPTDVVAPYCLPKSKAAAAAVTAGGVAGGKAGARTSGPPSGVETRRAAGEDQGWGDETPDTSDDPDGTAAAAAAAAAVRESFMRPGTAGVHHRGPSERTGGAEFGSMNAHVKGVKHEGGGKGHPHHHHHNHHHHHHHHHRRQHRPHGDAAVGASDRAPTTAADGGAPKPPPSSAASPPASAAPPRPTAAKSPRWAPAKAPPILPPVSAVGLPAPGPLRRPTSGGGQGRGGGAAAAAAAAAASALPSLDFREFLLVVVQVLRELDADAVVGPGGAPYHPAEGDTVGGHGGHAVAISGSVFQVFDVARRGALHAEDLLQVLSGFGGESLSADQAVAMVELAASAAAVGVDRAVARPLPPGVEGVGFHDFSAVYEMVQQVNRRLAEGAATATPSQARSSRADSNLSACSIFKLDRPRRSAPPSPDMPNGGHSPPDLPPLQGRSARCGGSRSPTPRRSSGHDKGGPGGPPRPEGRLRQWAQALTPGGRSSRTSTCSTSSRSSSPLSTSASSYSTSTVMSGEGVSTKAGAAVASPSSAPSAEGRTAVVGANLV